MNSLPPELLEIVMLFAETKADVLRAVCRLWRELLAPPECSGSCPCRNNFFLRGSDRCEWFGILRQHMRAGKLQRVEWLLMVCEMPVCAPLFQEANYPRQLVNSGRASLCRMVLERGIHDAGGVQAFVHAAAAQGRADVCELLMDVARRKTSSGEKIACEVWGEVPDLILVSAAESGNEELCHLAKQRGAQTLNSMLCSAAKGGHRHLCILAKEWGATAFSFMEMYAREGQYPLLVALAREWIREEGWAR